MSCPDLDVRSASVAGLTGRVAAGLTRRVPAGLTGRVESARLSGLCSNPRRLPGQSESKGLMWSE